jgi:hypothetical protein
LKTASTIAEAQEIQRGLREASRLLSPIESEVDTRPARVLWELVTGTVVGTATALVSGGRPAVQHLVPSPRLPSP